MPELQRKKQKIIHMNVWNICKESLYYLWQNKIFMLCVFAVNMVFMLLFKSLDGGISNPLSILWMIAYYIFWCFFYRYYYGLTPYFLSKVILGSLAPSTKALLILFLLALTIMFLPMIPLILGFNDVYLDIYENYLSKFEASASGENIHIYDAIVLCLVMSLVAPALICKPYLAWISSLRGMNASFKKVQDKIRGNYKQLVIVSLLLLIPETLSAQADKVLNLQGWLDYTGSTIVFIFTNVIFAKIYDFFYLKN